MDFSNFFIYVSISGRENVSMCLILHPNHCSNTPRMGVSNYMLNIAAHGHLHGQKWRHILTRDSITATSQFCTCANADTQMESALYVNR
jgi:hypothetical protein